MDGIRLIVGLGNPGSRYERTRHNAGFLVVERILTGRCRRWFPAGKGESIWEEATIRLGANEFLLARPLMYMNRSGNAVSDLLRVHDVSPASMLVVVDDVALPPGRFRLRVGGGHGGHNGLRSIRDATGTGDFPRLRVGVGSPAAGIDLADFVLESLSGEAWAYMEAVVAAAADVVEVAITRGLVAAMDAFNRDPAPQAGPPAGGTDPADRALPTDPGFPPGS